MFEFWPAKKLGHVRSFAENRAYLVQSLQPLLKKINKQAKQHNPVFKK